MNSKAKAEGINCTEMKCVEQEKENMMIMKNQDI